MERHLPLETVRKTTGGQNASAAKAKALLLQSASTTNDDITILLARSICYGIMQAWWSAYTADCSRYSLRPLFEAIDFPELPPASIPAIDSIGISIAELPPDKAAYEIGQIYTTLLPTAYRAKLGVYYTPPLLVERLIDQATFAGVDWTSCRVLDPACGGGAFLAPVIRRILNALPNVTPAILLKNIGSRIRGFEIDPFAGWLSQVTVDAVLLEVAANAQRKIPILVKICDSLCAAPPRERFDLVIGNPPYGRIKLPPDERKRFKRSLYGHANNYGLFTDVALRFAKPGGVIAYVTPTSFLAGEYFKNLRSLLGKTAKPVTIDFVASRKDVFADVLQETLLATYRKNTDSSPAVVHEVLPTGPTDLRVAEAGHFEVPSDPSLPWIVPRSPGQAKLIKTMGDMPHRLSDWGYKVSTGPLVWNRHKPQLRSRPKGQSFPLIWAEAVTTDGQFLFRAEKKNHEPYFEAFEHDEWLITREPCVLLQRTTSKEQNRRLIAAALPPTFLKKHGAVVIENHLNMLRPLTQRPKVSPAVLAAFLNSKAADDAFRCVSGSVAVSAYELESLPLPSPDNLKPLASLIRRKAPPERIEDACRKLFATPARG